MPTRTEKHVYDCNSCHEQFESYEDAKTCEEKHSKKDYDQKRDRVLPQRHSKDDKYTRHCVNCGEKLVEWDSVFDGHRNDRGDVTYSVSRCVTFGGLRCDLCYAHLEETIVAHLSRSNSGNNFMEI